MFKWRNQQREASPGQQWLMLGVTVAVLTASILLYTSKRTENNMREFCAEKYQQAHTGADSVKVDRIQVMPSSRRGGGGVWCSAYRGAK